MINRVTTIKDVEQESRLFFSRIMAASVIFALLVLVLVGRLIDLQIFDHEHYTTQSIENRVKITALIPTRGLIYDRNGVLLAQNLPAFSLEVIPEQVPDLNKKIKQIGKIIDLSDADLARFKNILGSKRRFEGVPLRIRLNEAEVAKFAINRHRFPGFDIQTRLVRHYPQKNQMAHVVGYVGRISEPELKSFKDPTLYSGISHIGKIGIEKTYEDILRGRVGLQRIETNAEGRVVNTLKTESAIPGQNLFLNIDARLQKIASDALKNEKGAVVAMDPNSGAVLAMVSNPDYDPNPFVSGIDQKSYDALLDSKARPLFNRVLRGQYPPGSTIKPFIGLAGLEYKVVNSSNHLYCEGHYLLEGDERKYRDWKKEGHGRINLSKGIVESCDVFFYDLALNLGIDRISAYLKQFGFGSRTGIDITGELPGLLPSREWKRRAKRLPWFPGETLISGIGQGFNLTTPLQLASATATLANGGKRIQPQLLFASQAADGQVTRQALHYQDASVYINRQSNWDYVVKAMRRVVHSPRGTARRIGRNLRYKIAGKTGTAQIFGIKQDEEYVQEEIPKELRDHALFIGFAPAKNPTIAVAVIVENGGSGGAVASPIAAKVIAQHLAGPRK